MVVLKCLTNKVGLDSNVKVNFGLSFSTEDTKQIPIIPGLSSGVGTMIYAGSIGTQIANELIDSYRCIVCIYCMYLIGRDDIFVDPVEKWVKSCRGHEKMQGHRG